MLGWVVRPTEILGEPDGPDVGASETVAPERLHILVGRLSERHFCTTDTGSVTLGKSTSSAAAPRKALMVTLYRPSPYTAVFQV